MAADIFSVAFLFLVSLASNATPFFGVSYTFLATTALLSYGFTPEGFVLVVLVTAAGASIGKLVLYAGGKGMKGRLRQNRNVNLLEAWLKRRKFLAVVFVTAVIPGLPLDDYVYLGAGAGETRLARMFVVTLLAKIVKSFFEIGIQFAGLGRIFTVSAVLGLSPLDTSILLSAVFVVMGVAFYKVDFTKLVSKFRPTNH